LALNFSKFSPAALKADHGTAQKNISSVSGAQISLYPSKSPDIPGIY